ncbi:MAG TPA: dTDP-4-dehydrorhamnose 3,5-epimerase [Bacteroidales bacterium]|nr:dTDP-4-dehydrorhamnose 3,5-epimerase [Bacteroidales bacterium]
MEIVKTEIPDVLIIKPVVFRDERGYFFESFHSERYREAGIDFAFVQDNESKSQKGVLRGLHLQKPPFAQGKLIRVVKGAVLDVVVDVRRNSPYYGKWVSTILTEENKWMFWVPPGFAHGFLTLENDTVFFYKCTAFYNKGSEMAIRWNDPQLAINWGIEDPILSEKDKNSPFFSEFISPF